MKALSDEELAGISGGTYTAEAQDWIERNKEEVYSRVGKTGILNYALSYGEKSSTVYDVSDIKTLLKNYGYDCDDLT